MVNETPLFEIVFNIIKFINLNVIKIKINVIKIILCKMKIQK